MKREAFRFFAIGLSACAQTAFGSAALAGSHDALIAKHAATNGVPEQLVRRIIRIESRGNATLAHRGNYGLMQIRLGTARGVGYSGNADGLLDPDTNLTYAVRYLAGAYRAAECDADRAVRYYQRGYYGAAQRECGGSSPEVVQIAKAKREMDSLKTKLDAVATKPADVIKPKLVRTETIATPKSGPAPVRPVGNFEPTRIAPPPAQPIAVTNPVQAKPESPSMAGMLKSATTDSSAKIELASIPLPPARPEFAPPTKRKVELNHRSGRIHERAGRKSKTNTKSRADSKPKIESTSNTANDPAGVVSLLKKLVTPDKTARRRAGAAQSDPPSHIQPPQ
jgi:hypothetical protein